MPVKFDTGKPRTDLLMPDSLLEISEVLSFGAAKYSDNQWRGLEQKRLYAAALRHLFKAALQDDYNSLDEESGLRHLAHAGTCIMMMLANKEEL